MRIAAQNIWSWKNFISSDHVHIKILTEGIFVHLNAVQEIARTLEET